MKTLTFVLCFLLFACCAYSQQDEPTKTLPSIKELPREGEVKTFYEFESSKSYKVYNQKGELVKEGTSNKIDVTELDKGTYFIAYDDKRIAYKKE
ncbi:MAG: T9SS type A sorting domain-containing protein [Bacteroidota bacterium]